MENITINELHEETVLGANSLEAVKGGPAFLKLRDIEGEAEVAVSEELTLNFTKVQPRY